jgi:hypothetical protein
VCCKSFLRGALRLAGDPGKHHAGRRVEGARSRAGLSAAGDQAPPFGCLQLFVLVLK